MGRAERWAALVAAGCFVLFAATVCPTVPFGDGGELIAAADCFGVAHPPGYPLYTALGWLALRLSPGEPALGMNLLSALFGALTCGAVAWLLVRVTDSAVAAVSASLALAASSTFWWVSTVTEVYTLHLFLMTCLLAGAWWAGAAGSRSGRERGLLVAALALGVGLGHHPTIVLVLPAAAVLVLSRKPDFRRRALAVAAAAAVLIPLVLALSLLARARLDPPSNWGQPTTVSSLMPHVTAAVYRHLDLGWSGLVRSASWVRFGELLWHEFTPVALPLALLSLPGTRWARFRGAVWLLLASSVAFGLRYTAPDIEVFFLPAFLALAFAAGLGVAWLTRHSGRALRVVSPAAAILLVAAPLVAHLPSRNLRGMTAAADYGRDILDTVPRGGVLFVEVDDAFVLLYLHQVLEERPDVAIYDRNGNLFRDLFRETDLRPQPGEPPRLFRVRLEQAFIARQASRGSEVSYLGWPGFEPPRGVRFEPVGLLYRATRAGGPPLDDRSVWAGYRERQVREQAFRVGEGFARAVAATYPLARGERALFLGRRPEADARLQEAMEVAGANAGMLNYIGTLYGRIGDYLRAEAAFRRAIEIMPTSIRAWNNLALAGELAGDRELAIEAWRRSLELAPGQPEGLEALQRLGAPPGEQR